MPKQTFNHNGETWQKFNVPNGVETVTISIEGGSADVGTQRGGKVTGTVNVKNTSVLWVLVGGRGLAATGTTGGKGGAGGGANGGNGRGGAGGGGHGGAGGTFIRRDTQSGSIVAVAGGAGGSYGGAGGGGGNGGAATGEAGNIGNDGPTNGVSTGTGGSQNQAGKGGNTFAGSNYGGKDGNSTNGGKGGQVNSGIVFGGGGGGGGYKGGGGGAASKGNNFTGSGGGAGSNYVGGMKSAVNLRGEAGTGHGTAVISWSNADSASDPNAPTSVKIDGKNDSGDEQATGWCGGDFKISAVISAKKGKGQKAEPKVRLRVRISDTKNFSKGEFGPFFCDDHGGARYGENNKRHTAEITGLKRNTLYYVRLQTQDNNGDFGPVTTTSFWTNRLPKAPNQLSPPDNTSFPVGTPPVMSWNFRDDDPQDAQEGYDIRYRLVKDALGNTGPWRKFERPNGKQSEHTFQPDQFDDDSQYEWQVRTYDGCANKAGPWSDSAFFYVGSATIRPKVISPTECEAIDAQTEDGVRFRWRFIDPNGDEQQKADIRFRVIGEDGEPGDWQDPIFGDPVIPGTDTFWDFPAGTFQPGVTYNWQVRTYDSGGAVSAWSRAGGGEGCFVAIASPGGLNGEALTFGKTQEALGCGEYRVYVFERGGQKLVGEITPTSLVRWNRVRDDISRADIWTNGFSEDCCGMLSGLRSWIHEIVIFRDGIRVWEGPITRITYRVDRVEIEAKDVMAYVYRRILRQGYNDSYRLINNQQLGLTRITERAQKIIMNALSYDDPNVLGYLSVYLRADDSRQSRVRKAYSVTAWEEVDDLAATAGLDYTTVGRRIVLWDTHNPIGKLPEMRDGDFGDDPIVTEYGMQLANFFATTNNNGVYGTAIPEQFRDGSENSQGTEDEYNRYYGSIEMLASAYGEADGAAPEALSPKARARLENALTEQSQRNIAARWPAPLVVRVPDNTTLNPKVNLTINQLIPGAWIPLRSTGTCRPVSQWQKLDLVSVEYTENGETISVTMSPAPNGGQDPDAIAVEVEA